MTKWWLRSLIKFLIKNAFFLQFLKKIEGATSEMPLKERPSSVSANKKFEDRRGTKIKTVLA